MERTLVLGIVLTSLVIGSAAHAQDERNFGDDSGDWAYDGACDDNRFVGSDPHYFHWSEGEFNERDATDCRTLVEAGLINWRDAQSSEPLADDKDSVRSDIAEMRAHLESLLSAVLRIEAGLEQAGYIFSTEDGSE